MERTGNGQQGKDFGLCLGRSKALLGKLLLLSGYTDTLSPSNCLLTVSVCARRLVLLSALARGANSFPCSVVVTTETHMVKTMTVSEGWLVLNGTFLHLLLGSGNTMERRTEGQ